jgi:hypothetical protein
MGVGKKSEIREKDIKRRKKELFLRVIFLKCPFEKLIE